MNQGFSKNKSNTSVPQLNSRQRGTNNHVYSQRQTPPAGNPQLFGNPEEYSRQQQQITQAFLQQAPQSGATLHPLAQPAGPTHDMSQQLMQMASIPAMFPGNLVQSSRGPTTLNNPGQPQPSTVMQQSAPSPNLMPTQNHGAVNMGYYTGQGPPATAQGRANLQRNTYNMAYNNSQGGASVLLAAPNSSYPAGQLFIQQFTNQRSPSYSAASFGNPTATFWPPTPHVAVPPQPMTNYPHNAVPMYLSPQCMSTPVNFPNNSRPPPYLGQPQAPVPAPQSAQPKRERKILEIRDPKDNKLVDLKAEIQQKLEPEHPEPVHQLSPQAIEFVTQVTQAATSGNKAHTDPNSEPPLSRTSSALDPPDILSTQVDYYSPPQPEILQDFPPQCSIEEEPLETISSATFVPSQPSVEPIEVPPLVEEDQTLQSSPSLEIPSAEIPESIPNSLPSGVDYDILDSIPLNDNLDNLEESIEDEPVLDKIPTHIIEPSTDKGSNIVIEASQPITPVSETLEIPPEKLEVPPPRQPPPVAPPVEQPPPKTVPPPVKPESDKHKKKKKAEFNKKANEKEGTDMDAFLGEEKPTINIKTNASTLIEVQQNHVNELKDEEKKVAEKNEENVRVSNENNIEEDKTEAPPNDEVKTTLESEESTEPPPMQLKYKYDDDQWSPINPSGKKKYGRDFLLKMQYESVCLKKPDLPAVEIIRDTPMARKFPDNTLRFPTLNALPSREADPFMPTFVRANSQMRGSQGGGMKGRRVHPSQEKTKKLIIAPSVPQTVELRTTENAWKPLSRLADANKNQEELKDEKVFREVRSILNKLTPEKFDSLLKQLKEIQIDSISRLQGVINLVFEKAVDEPKFSVPYATLCTQIAMMKVTVEDGNSATFRKLLLTKCQKEFEKDYRDDEKLVKLQEEIDSAENEEKRQQKKEEYEEQLRKARRRSLGNIRFIGELYKMKMLTGHIMHDCLKKLLSQGDEDSLECFCHLIHTIGQTLDKQTKTEAKLSKYNMDDYFKTVKGILDTGEISSRIKFLLLDTIEFKENNYVSLRISTPAQNTPKTIATIHQEAQRDALKAQQESHLAKRSDDRDRKKGRGSTNYQSNQQQQQQQSEDGWNLSGSGRSKKDYILEPTKKLSKLDADSLQFGRGSLHSWGRGSSGGGAKQQHQSEDKTVCSNRYSALATDSDSHRRGGQRSAASSRESSRNGRSGQLGAPPGIRKSHSQTAASNEKEEVISMLKTIVKGSQSQKLSSSSTDGPAGEGKGGKRSTDSLLRGKDLPFEKIESQAKMMLDEYLVHQKTEETIELLIDVASPNTIDKFLSQMLNHLLDRSDQARVLYGHLLAVLLIKKIVNLDVFTKVLNEFVLSGEDFVVDYPKYWHYLAEMVAPVFLVKDISAAFLLDICKECCKTSTSTQFITALLKVVVDTGKHIEAGEKWRSANLQLSDFLESSADVAEYISKNKFEFLVNPPEVFHNQSYPALLEILKEKNDNTAAVDWIEAKVGDQDAKQPKFIRALTTTILEFAITGSGSNCSFNEESLRSRMPLLLKYTDHHESLELEVLYAVQVLMSRLEHPKNLINSIFYVLLDEEVITEDTFNKWKNCQDPLEKEGRSMALVSSQQFFKMLQETPEE